MRVLKLRRTVIVKPTPSQCKNPKYYNQQSSQVIAAEQLIKEGFEVHAGDSVKLASTHSEGRQYERRVKAAQLVEEGINPDCSKYLFCFFLQLTCLAL